MYVFSGGRECQAPICGDIGLRRQRHPDFDIVNISKILAVQKGARPWPAKDVLAKDGVLAAGCGMVGTTAKPGRGFRVRMDCPCHRFQNATGKGVRSLFGLLRSFRSPSVCTVRIDGGRFRWKNALPSGSADGGVAAGYAGWRENDLP